jgi:three-Cys-motif partner protein
MTSTRPRRKSNQPEIEGQEMLFPVSDFEVDYQVRLKPITRPLWTESKAALVARYLYYFVLITHHGTYLDAFAGPQRSESTEGWTADLVLKNKPTWLNKFYLFEKDQGQLAKLIELKNRNLERKVVVTEGDVNLTLPTVLSEGALREKEASFCLLDQRTFECKWQTVKYLAALKPSGLKVEQFYFLAQGWLDRAFAATSTDTGHDDISQWWGNDEWNVLTGMRGQERAELLSRRFTEELGYKSAAPWPIFERGDQGRIMYFMIHATDHPEAPVLMRRAYEWAVAPVAETVDQLEMEFQDVRDRFTAPFDGPDSEAEES